MRHWILLTAFSGAIGRVKKQKYNKITEKENGGCGKTSEIVQQRLPTAIFFTL